jgi:hypothetical protein
MPEYDAGPAGDVRRGIANGSFPLPNSPEKIAQAMIDLVDSGEVPLRLPLGVDTYADVRASLMARLEEHDAHRAVAESVARDDLVHRHPEPGAAVDEIFDLIERGWSEA